MTAPPAWRAICNLIAWILAVVQPLYVVATLSGGPGLFADSAAWHPYVVAGIVLAVLGFVFAILGAGKLWGLQALVAFLMFLFCFRFYM